MYIDLPNPRPLSNNVDLEKVWYTERSEMNSMVGMMPQAPNSQLGMDGITEQVVNGGTMAPLPMVSAVPNMGQVPMSPNPMMQPGQSSPMMMSANPVAMPQ